MADEEQEAQSPEAEGPPAPPKEPTTAGAWRGLVRKRWRLGLPSGATVIARQVDPASLMLDGAVTAEEFMAMTAPTTDATVLRERVAAAQRACCAIVVEPPVAYSNGSGEPLPDDVMDCREIPAADALGILSWSLGGASPLVTVDEALGH